MDRSKVVAIAVVAILLGAVGGFFLGFAQRPEALPLPAARPETPVVPAPEKSVPDLTQLDAPKAAPMDELLARIGGSAALPGNGEIRGSVRTESGAPLPGVAITCTARMNSASPAADRPLGDEVADFIRQRRDERGLLRSTVSGADGTYELAGLADNATYLVTAELAGYRLDRMRPNPYRVAAGATVDFTAKAAAIIEVVLKMPDGSAPQQGRVGYGKLRADRRVESDRGTTWEAPFRRLELEAGFWRITGSAGPNADDYISDPIELEVVVGAPPRRVEVQLRGRLVVFGFVSTPPGYGWDVLHVHLQPNPPAQAPRTDADVKAGARHDTTGKTSGYAFRFEDIEAGTHRAVACDPTGAVADWKDVVVTDGPVEVRLTMPEARREDFIVVRVKTPDGSVARDARLDLNLRGDAGDAGIGVRPLIQPDGSYWLPRTAQGAEPDFLRGREWRYEITASHPKYMAAKASYERGDTHDLELQFKVPAFLTLQTTGFVEHPQRTRLYWGVVPRGRSFSASNPSIELAKYGEEGNKDRIKPEPRFGPFEPGEYDLVLSGSFGNFGALEILRQPVTLAGGDNTAAAAVPRLNTLTVTLPQGATSRFIMIRPKGSAQQRGPTVPDFKDGRSVIDLLPDGEWVLFDGVGEMVVSAPGPAEVVFEPKHYDALRVKCQAGAWIEQLGFRNDDVVVEIDGQAFKGMEAAWALVTLSTSKEKTSWKVIRSGAEIDVAFDGRDLAKLRDPKSINDPQLVAGYR